MIRSQIVPVSLGPRSYDIAIGQNILGEHSQALCAAMPSNRAVIITDVNVERLHGETLRAALDAVGIEHEMIIRPAGEEQKSFEGLQDILTKMLDMGLTRKDSVIAFGGGVIGDLAGFAASIYKRGCAFIQIPTTLLAQVDSSVGGKTAINTPQGKNLIGAFYQPQFVLADSAFLKTLPEREIKAGYAEVLKYGLLGDATFFDWLDGNGADVLALKPDAIKHAVAVSCQTKARIVAADEREQGQRALLNLGHTFAHALEAEAGYGSRLLHGEAVSAGLEMAFAFCARAGFCPQDDADQVSDHIARMNLVGIRAVKDLTGSAEVLAGHMMHDKKNEGSALTLILARGIGASYIEKNADKAALLEYLHTLT